MRDSSRIPQRSTSSHVLNQAGAEQEVHTYVHGVRLSLWSGCAKSNVTEVRDPEPASKAPVGAMSAPKRYIDLASYE